MSALQDRASMQSESTTGPHVAVQPQNAPGAVLCGPGDDKAKRTYAPPTPTTTNHHQRRKRMNEGTQSTSVTVVQYANGAALCVPGAGDLGAVERTAARLDAQGIWLSADLRVSDGTAADLLGVGPRSLRDWRQEGWGPTYVCADRQKITYRLSDLLAWIDSRSVDPARH